MHTVSPYDTKDEVANGPDEKFIENVDGYSDQHGAVTADERAMTRRILLNLDFRYAMLSLRVSTSYLWSS